MPSAVNQYRPDYGVPPGRILNERLAVNGISPAQLAARCGFTQSHIDDIIAGKAAVSLEDALKFERELGLAADVWVGLETKYQRYLDKVTESENQSSLAWLNKFPINELVERGEIDGSESESDAVIKLLTFFDVDSVSEWSETYAATSVAYRHSPAFKSDEFVLATWMRLGALEAERQKRADYDVNRFDLALREIRRLTRESTGPAFVKAQALCNDAGVALVRVKPMIHMALSGAAWWLVPGEPVMQLSGRHKTNDNLWFTLFHEAAHILLHGKEHVFIDTTQDEIAGVDAEADRWASDFLIPRADWDNFADVGRFEEWAVCQFAQDQGIAPAIVVGRLQRERRIPWSRLNHLKAKMRWQEAE